MTGDNFGIPGMLKSADEDATGLNQADGDDIIVLGNNIRGPQKIYGQGGNDKIIGGYVDMDGAPSMKFFYGGSGDDRIWAVSPE